MGRVWWGMAATAAMMMVAVPAAAQWLDATTPGETRPELPGYLPGKPGIEVQTPPLADGGPLLSSGLRFVLRQVQFRGGSVFTGEQLGALAAPYLGRPLGAEDLVRLRNDVTRQYYQRGYVTSGAVIPDQNLRDGVLTVVLVEGTLGQVASDGLDYLRPAFVAERVLQGLPQPFNVRDLQEQLLLLLNDAPVARLDAELGPGDRPGEGRLSLTIEERPRYWAAVQAANDRSPSIGALHGQAEVGMRSVLGWSDPVQLTFGGSEGLYHGAVSYQLPLGASGLTLLVAGEAAKSTVVEEPLNAIDVDSETWAAEIGLRYAVVHQLDRDLSIGVKLARRHSTTYLLGEPYSYDLAAEDGRSDVTALRLPVEWAWRGQRHVIAARSTLSIGLPWLGATIHGEDDLADSRFFAWLGQAQAAVRTDASGQQLVLRADAQVTSAPLLAIEQIAVGGMASVRGYRENQLVRDNAVIASAEYRVPVLDIDIAGLDGGRPDDGRLYIAPFIDAAHAWSADGALHDWLASAGLGMMWSPGERLSVELAYGYRLLAAPDSQDSDILQDNGLHFRVRWRL